MVSDTLLAFLASEYVLIASYDDVKGFILSLRASLGNKLGANLISWWFRTFGNEVA